MGLWNSWAQTAWLPASSALQGETIWLVHFHGTEATMLLNWEGLLISPPGVGSAPQARCWMFRKNHRAATLPRRWGKGRWLCLSLTTFKPENLALGATPRPWGRGSVHRSRPGLGEETFTEYLSKYCPELQGSCSSQHKNKVQEFTDRKH